MRVGDAPMLAATDPDWDEADWRGFLEGGSAVGMVAIRGGATVPNGFIVGRAVRGEIVQLAVDEDVRRRGVGAALLKAFLDAHAPKSCFLEVREDNTAALALYRAHGFETAGVRKGYYRDRNGAVDAICMRLDSKTRRD